MLIDDCSADKPEWCYANREAGRRNCAAQRRRFRVTRALKRPLRNRHDICAYGPIGQDDNKLLALQEFQISM